MKISEAVLEAAVNRLLDQRINAPKGEELDVIRQDVREALGAALEQLREEQLATEVIEDAREGFNADCGGPGRWMGSSTSLPHPDRISNAINAAWDSVLGDKEEGL